MKNNPSGISSFYRSHAHSHHTLRMAVDMNERIDGTALRRAADIAIKRYDYFSVSFIQKKDELLHSVVPNARPIVITAGAEPVTLLTEESNGHALALAYEGKTVYFDIVHSIADATGLLEFIKTTLYYYITEKYGRKFPADHIRTADMPVTEEERKDPYLNPPAPAKSAAPSQSAAPSGKGGAISPAVPWDRIMPADRSCQTMYKLSVSEQAFMEFVRANNGTPAIMTSSLLAEAVYDLCRELGAPFRIAMMKNYRPVLGTPLAHNNVLGNIVLNYTDEMRALPVDQLCGMARQMVAYQSTDEFVRAAIRNRLEREGKILALGDQAAVRTAFRQAAEASLKHVNLTVSYVGQLQLGALEPYIRAIYDYVDPSPSHMVVELNAVGGRFCYTFLQDFASGALVHGFVNRMEQAGLSVELGEEEPLVYPRMQI